MLTVTSQPHIGKNRKKKKLRRLGVRKEEPRLLTEPSFSLAGQRGWRLVQMLLGVLCQFFFGLVFVLFGCCIVSGICML